MSNSRLVVMVEDSATQAKAIAMYLNQLGLEVVICGDGPEGIAAINQYQPVVAILDVNLPTMNGFQIARHIKRNPATCDIPVIMLTKSDENKDMMRGYSNGADHYIGKGPDTAKELWKTLCALGIVDWM